MVLATANLEETQRLDLKSLPGGYVEARRLTYGQKIQRRSMTSALTLKSQGKSKDFEGEMNMINLEATIFDFSKCIVAHNLEKEINQNTDQVQTVPIDFNNKEDVKRLDPRVGEEIDEFLGKINNFDEEDSEEGN